MGCKLLCIDFLFPLGFVTLLGRGYFIPFGISDNQCNVEQHLEFTALLL